MDTRLRRLFLDTVRDLGDRCISEDTSDYDMMHCSLLVRRLFLDGGRSIVDLVNRDLRLRLVFDVIDGSRVDQLRQLSPVSHLALSPGWRHPNARGRVEMTRNRFFCAPVGYIRGESIAVQDIVRYVAHVAGGAHFGSANEAHEIGLRDMDEINQTLEGRDISLRFLCNIGLIAHRALQPMVEKI